MEWFIAILAVGVLGFAALAASGGLGQLGPMNSDRPLLNLPDGDLTSEDIADLRFLVVPRGYAMDQVDEVLARLESQLYAHEGDYEYSYADLINASNSEDGPESGIIESNQLNDRRNHDGSDETSNR